MNINIRISGISPGIKKAAALAAAAVFLTGCSGDNPPDSSYSESVSQSVVSCTSEDPGGEPVISDSGGDSPNESASSSVSGSVPESGTTPSSSDDPESSSEPASTDSSSGSAASSDPQPPSSSSSSSSQSASSQSTGSSASSSSSIKTSSSSSSSSAPPAEVKIPAVKVPTSPGTNTLTSSKGVIDYSNASQGYISAKYTGSSSKVKLRITFGGDQKTDYDLSASGKTEYYPLYKGSGSYTAAIYEQLEGTKYNVAVQGSFNASMNETSAYLYPNRYVNFNQNSACVKKAAEVCAGKTNDIDKIAAVFEFVTDQLDYDSVLAANVKSGYVPDPDATIAKRTGICFDYASLVAAMLRSQSIPTRLAVGYVNPDLYHAWNEVYTPETGWITPYLFLKKHGYNLIDATLYDGKADKEKFSVFVGNDANYSAVFYY